jgi:hypothetical protein
MRLKDRSKAKLVELGSKKISAKYRDIGIDGGSRVEFLWRSIHNSDEYCNFFLGYRAGNKDNCTLLDVSDDIFLTDSRR